MQGVALGEEGQESLHRNGLTPKIQIGDQLITLLGAVPTKTDISTAFLRAAEISCNSLAAVATHRLLNAGRLLAHIAQRSHQGLAIAELSFDRAEVRHGGLVVWVGKLWTAETAQPWVEPS